MADSPKGETAAREEAWLRPKGSGTWLGLPLALSFLTVFPLPRGWRAGESPPPPAAAAAFPVAGVAVGAVGAVVYIALARILPVEVAALGAVLAAYLVTGCMHLDGLADTADGLAAAARGAGREQALAAMRDPRLGAQGVLAIVAAVLAKTLLAASLASAAAPALLAAPALGRWGMVLLMPLLRYARDGPGLGSHFAGRVGWATAGWTTLLALGMSWATLLAAGYLAGARLGPGLSVPAEAAVVTLAMAGAGGMAALGVGLAAARRLGGVTGDVYGAANEAAEVTVLAVAAMLA